MKFSPAVALPLWLASLPAAMALPVNEARILERDSQCGAGTVGGIMEDYPSFAKPFCAIYDALPVDTGAISEAISSACACLSATATSVSSAATSTASASVTSLTSVSASVTSASASFSIPTASSNLTSVALAGTAPTTKTTKTKTTKTKKTKTSKTKTSKTKKTKTTKTTVSATMTPYGNLTSIIGTGTGIGTGIGTGATSVLVAAAATTKTASTSAATSSSVTVVSSATDAASSSTSTSSAKASTSSAKASTSSATASTSSSATVATSVASVSVAVPTSTTGASVTVSIAASCTVTEFSALAAATKACTNIMLKDIAVPADTTLDLSGVSDGATIVFSGTTTFAYAEDDYNMILVSGTDIEVTGEAGAVIDGNGSAWWDGEGSNGGKTKPDHFFVVKDMAGSSSIHDLTIKNWPVHCFSITGSDGLSVYSLTLDNSDGDAPNSASGSDPAAHNSDGFDLSSTTNTILYDITVINQDDCVAVTSGTNITISNFYCSGGHGLSIGSVGGKSNNVVTDITFENSQIVNSSNGARIKTNYGTTGSVTNIVYQNIVVSGITAYGIDIQQDYLNGGPTGTPSNGVTITGVTMTNITGTATSDAINYYILCGTGCSDFVFNDISITGGSDDSCNVTPTGDFSCA